MIVIGLTIDPYGSLSIRKLHAVDPATLSITFRQLLATVRSDQSPRPSRRTNG